MESVQVAGMDLRQESDEDLLVFMTMRSDDLAVANAAFAEFYERHVHYLFRRCRGCQSSVCSMNVTMFVCPEIDSAARIRSE